MRLCGVRQPRDGHTSDDEHSQVSPGDIEIHAGTWPSNEGGASRMIGNMTNGVTAIRSDPHGRPRGNSKLSRERAATAGRHLIQAALSGHFMGNREGNDATAKPPSSPASPALGRRRSRAASSGRSRAASAGRSILQMAFTQRPPLPGAFRNRPSGTMEVPCNSVDVPWAECLRDLTRTLHGKGVYIVGPEQMYPLRAEMKTLGDLNRKACEAAFGSLMRAVCDELTAQGAKQGINAAAPAIPLRGSLWRQQSGTVNNWQLDSLELRELTRRVATHITVGPGMHVVLKQKLSPVLLQPAFVICISRSQVRVLTFAFIGEPVTGDRPETKRTPFILRLLTGNLAAAAPQSQASPDDSGTGVQTSSTAVHYTAEVVGVPALVLDHILGMREQLCQLVRDEDWRQLVPFSCDPLVMTTS